MSLQGFAAKLFLLQNMKNKDFLIHNRLMKQEFGPEDICIWMPEQKQIIDEAREIFQNEDGPKFQWVIRGCMGSGKTLVLTWGPRLDLKPFPAFSPPLTALRLPFSHRDYVTRSFPISCLLLL